MPWVADDGREIALDNGQHILIGAYHATLALMQRLGIDLDHAFDRAPLHLVSTKGLDLQASNRKAPWHLVSMILKARGLSIDERWSMAMLIWRAKRARWTLPEDCTVAALLATWQQPVLLTHKLWDPLCVAALNTPVDIASAQVFLNVLRDSLGADARDSDLLLPRVDLGSMLPDAVSALFAEHANLQSSIRLGTRIQNLNVDDHGVAIAAGTATDVGSPERFDAAVLAVPPPEAARLMAPMALRDARYRSVISACERFVFQPIVTVYLRYREAPRWSNRMLALESAPHVDHFVQWAFDRSECLSTDLRHVTPTSGRGLVAAVISAEGVHRQLESDVLIAAIAKQLATECGMPSQPLESRIITEKRATFACTPGLPRQDTNTPHARLVLAGDYVGEADPTRHYPATIEAAVLSGERAADRLIALLDE